MMVSVGYKYIAIAVHCHTARIKKAATQAYDGRRGGDAPIYRQYLFDCVVANVCRCVNVGKIYIATRVHCDAFGIAEVFGQNSDSRCGRNCTVDRQHLINRICVRVGNIEISSSVQSHPIRLNEAATHCGANQCGLRTTEVSGLG